MKQEDVRAHIEQTARSFDGELHTKAYAETHSDAAQLRCLLSRLAPQEKQAMLDLGTGSGYVAMSLAKEHPTAYVTGLDIAPEAIRKDIEIAAKAGLTNVDFRVFDGVTLPFEDDTFDGAVCRYAFHHFPCGETTLEEIARTLRYQGKFVLADAIRNDEDETDFVNSFQDLKQDGHVKIHKSADLKALVSRHGFELVDCFETLLPFTRARSMAYDELFASTPKHIQASYLSGDIEDEYHLTFKILNATFVNRR
jgi:ubiquinone/menaquinone biosynthesis C-methylase UbiE